MLLNGSRERVRVRDTRDDEPRRRRAPARGRQAWVLLGGLDCALYQAGIIDVVIERIARPHAIFAGGASVLGAALALDGKALVFRIGWERIRAAHVLGAAALERAPLVRLRRNGAGARNGSSLPFELMRAVPDQRTPERLPGPHRSPRPGRTSQLDQPPGQRYLLRQLRID